MFAKHKKSYEDATGYLTRFLYGERGRVVIWSEHS